MMREVFNGRLYLGLALLMTASLGTRAESVPQDKAIVPLTTIETLRPTFAWKASTGDNVSYDLVVCLGVYDRHGYWMPGKLVYYREGLAATTNTLEQPLMPDTTYVWSARARQGKKTSLWAAYGEDDPKFLKKDRHHYRVMCVFKTPAK